jgi:hypothetical protein
LNTILPRPSRTILPRPAANRTSAAALLSLALAASLPAQPGGRHATNIPALVAYPGFFHGRSILVVGNVESKSDGQLQVSDDSGSVRVVFKGNAPDGLDEIRGEFWDLGRMKADDPRLTGYDLRKVFKVDPEAPWPRPGEVTAIMASAVASAAVPAAPSIRAIVLNPSRYLDQKVTISGQFSGRNLMGDLPDAPAKSRYDFVLRSSDAAIWVINMRPKGKDFDLGLDARIDTGRWLEVRGTIQQRRGLQWLDAEAGSLTLAKPPAVTITDEPQIRPPAGPPPEVIFSAPTADETEVLTATHVRIQFSRDIDQATFKNHIRVTYLDQTTGVTGAGELAAPVLEFATQYDAAIRVLELRFTKPLDPLRTLKVELDDGILGRDGQALKPWSLTFALGAS